MSVLLALWRAEFNTARNALRADVRTRIVWLIACIVNIGLGLWGGQQLLIQVAAWQLAGSLILQSHLWLLCLSIWSGIGALAVISMLQRGFATDDALLLITLPLPPAVRLRALYGVLLIKGVGNWLLLGAVVLGTVLALALGWQALSWLALALLGASIVVWCAMLATLLVIRYVLPHIRRSLLVGLLCLLVLIVIALAVHLFRAPGALPTIFAPSAPLSVLLLLLVCWLAALSVLAEPAGRLYLAAFHVMEGRPGARTTINIPGVRVASRLCARYRSLTGALFVKGLLNQGRHVLTWLRIIAVVIYLSVFPLVQRLALPYHIPPVLLLVGFVASVIILANIDNAVPYAISSEGNRLALYITAPLTFAGFLMARLLVFLLPALSISLPATLGWGWWAGLSPLELAAAVLAVLLVVTGVTALFVWGSAWDEDLNQTVEGSMQMLLQEELPVTPRRLQLLGLGLLLLAIMLLLLWKLPLALALPALVLLDGAVMMAVWRLSCARLYGLLRRG
ncbi:MAG: hypothetical protein H0W02_07570 [Ktedonobacteraceae bacterium]|nr:hypothetical protein [Ktedonobacteraceae bacterium]